MWDAHSERQTRRNGLIADMDFELSALAGVSQECQGFLLSCLPPCVIYAKKNYCYAFRMTFVDISIKAIVSAFVICCLLKPFFLVISELICDRTQGGLGAQNTEVTCDL